MRRWLLAFILALALLYRVGRTLNIAERGDERSAPQ